jgi:hypothetical protein
MTVPGRSDYSGDEIREIVMAGLVPAIYDYGFGAAFKTWMPATSAGMTIKPYLIAR